MTQHYLKSDDETFYSDAFLDLDAALAERFLGYSASDVVAALVDELSLEQAIARIVARKFAGAPTANDVAAGAAA